MDSDSDSECVIETKPEEIDDNEIDYNEIPIEIDDNGMVNEIYSTLTFKQKSIIKNKIHICTMCGKIFNKEMAVLYEDTGEETCYHCIYYLNYAFEQRQIIDGMYPLTIAGYIMRCSKSHNKMDCNRNCFLCDHLNGIDIVGIIDEDLVNSKKKIDEDEYEDEMYEYMTIEI